MSQEDWIKLAEMVKNSHVVLSDKASGGIMAAFFSAAAFEAQLRKEAAGALSVPSLVAPNGKPYE